MFPKALATAVVLLTGSFALLGADPVQLPNGFAITPTAAPRSVLLPLNPGLAKRPSLTLGQPVTTALSPDGSRLLVLTSGYNKEREQKNGERDEYLFVFDATVFPPKQLQALPLPNTFCGLAWNPSGREFYASGGVDDKMYVFARNTSAAFTRAAAVPLGHARGLGLLSNLPEPLNAAAPKPMAAGIAVNRSGTVAVVANLYNDSISFVDLKTRKVTGELDLRPGVKDPAKSGQPGGAYPYWVAIRGDETAFVSSPRDREIVVVSLGSAPAVAARIRVAGQPNRLILNKAHDRLFVALDNTDSVAVIDAVSHAVLQTVGVVAPAEILSEPHLPRGANPNSLALSSDERTLFVTDGGTNAVAVVSLAEPGSRVTGLIPTGWYPNSVSVSADGKTLYVANAKSVPGANPGNCRGDAQAPNIKDCERARDNYVYWLEKGSLLSLPIPPAAELAALTNVVSRNDHFDRVRSASEDPVIAELRKKIRHVIYIIKENRTYDQILGDLEVGDGDPSLTEFPEPITPNHHSLARRFVTLDNFLDSGEVSGVGWNWTTAARTMDYTEKTVPPNYAGRGFEYDFEGINRNVNVGAGTLEDRVKAQPLLAFHAPPDPNLLPGEADVAAPDSESGDSGAGYIWDEVLRAGLTVRNYGIFADLSRYNNPKNNPGYIPISRTPFADKLVQIVPAKRSLLANTDLYFRSFDQNQADYYLFKEWEREFDGFVASGNLPNLSLVRLAHDHFGSFRTALYGINTPALQIADNDYAIALVVEKVAKSSYADSTLICILEDDAQDGPDHVDAHRSVAYVVGPYVKQGAVVSERYTTVNMVRTIEALLGLTPSSLYSAAAAPMSGVFDLRQTAWSYTPIVPDLLRTTQLPLPVAKAGNSLPGKPLPLAMARRLRDVGYWNRRLGDMDYDEEDKLDTGRFNRELWKGMMGSQPYPAVRHGRNLREERQALVP